MLVLPIYQSLMVLRKKKPKPLSPRPRRWGWVMGVRRITAQRRVSVERRDKQENRRKSEWSERETIRSRVGDYFFWQRRSFLEGIRSGIRIGLRRRDDTTL